MAARLLFAGRDIYDFVEDQRERLKKAYEALPDEEALDEPFIADLKKMFMLDVPRLKLDEWTSEQEQITPNSIEVVAYIPFDGDPSVFDIRPSAMKATVAQGEIVDHEVLIRLRPASPQIDVAAYVKRELGEIQWRLESLRGSMEHMSQQLEITLRTCMQRRKRSIENRIQISENIGIPRRKPPVKPAAAASVPGQKHAPPKPAVHTTAQQTCEIEQMDKVPTSAPTKAGPVTMSIPNQPSDTENPEAELHKLAPTLADLRKLPPEQKDRLLLAQLTKMSRHNESILNKHNLTLSGDPYGMARFYSESERREVIEHLLAAPWTRLVNDGYLADFSGHGFYKVTAEGHEYLKQEGALHATTTPSNAPITLLARIEGIPRVFLSYSWEGDDHKRWVKALAERLQTDGIQVIFDRWYLKLGQDKLHFMESAVADSDYVAIICTEEYANRANQREGGVGWESMIITSEVAEHMLTDKFIPILRKGTFKTSLPRYLKTRMGVNLMGDPYNGEAYEELLRKFHGEPIAPPPIGAKPDFSKKTASKAKTLLQAAGEALAKQSEGALLGPLNKRPNASLHAQYDKPGTPGPWVHAIIRLWDIDGEVKYSLETSKGDELIGAKDDVISMFSNFNRKMIKEGYKRMSFSPGTDPDFQSL
ncbi:MAG: TIR domain-containing protein [Deltaproteobacteria bacterium]|nr:TIR domain-containing protein [Deltaproteobacteria bacterium]